jgi:hypothetical protein
MLQKLFRVAGGFRARRKVWGGTGIVADTPRTAGAVKKVKLLMRHLGASFLYSYSHIFIYFPLTPCNEAVSYIKAEASKPLVIS